MPASSSRPATPTACSGEAKSQFRIVLSRFFHQRLAMIGLAIFALLGIGSILVGHFWQYSYTTSPTT